MIPRTAIRGVETTTFAASVISWSGVAITLLLLSACRSDGLPPSPDLTKTSGALDLSHELPQALHDWPTTVGRPRYSRDARWIAFSSDREGTEDVYIVSTETNEVRRLTESPFDESRPAWSPNGSQVVFQSNRDGTTNLWILELEGRTTRRLTPIPHTEAAPDWSSTGELITYVSDANGSWDVWVIHPDGSGARPITTHEGSEYHPKFAPGGERITFYPTWHGWTDIATVGVADGDVVELVSGEYEDYRPVWSPDGEWIAFPSDRSESGGLWAAPAKGGEPVLVFESDVGLDYPDWRPDGGALIYVEESYETRLFRRERGEEDATPVTGDVLNAVDRNPDWGPDGSHLVFESSRYGNEGNVVLLDLSTGVERRLSSGRVNDGSPRFSLDGTRLTYVSGGGDQTDSQLQVADLDTGTTASWSDLRNVSFPAFCGNGALVFGWAEIAYVEEFELWYVAEGARARRIGDHVIERTGVDCSADGAWIIASLHQARGTGEDEPRLIRVDLETEETDVVTTGQVPHLHPRLSSDGTEVLFVAESDGRLGAYEVAITGGLPREVVPPKENATVADWAGADSFVYAAEERIGRARLVSSAPLEKR